MKSSSRLSQFSYHTWKDIGGPFGLLLDLIVCVFVVVAAFFMLLVGAVLLGLDYLASPVLKLVSRIRS